LRNYYLVLVACDNAALDWICAICACRGIFSDALDDE
jgi:hypothetical protein